MAEMPKLERILACLICCSVHTTGFHSEDISNPVLSADGRSLAHLWTGAREDVPLPRKFASLTSAESNLFLFGGEAQEKQPDGSNYLNDIYLFDTFKGQWSDELVSSFCCEDNAKIDVFGVRPSPRSQHASAYHKASKRMFVFGGITNRNGFNGELLSQQRYSSYGSVSAKGVDSGLSSSTTSVVPQYLDDIHFFDTDFTQVVVMRWSGKLSTIGSAPPPRAAHSMVAHGDWLYVFGGRSGHRLLNDLYKFNTITFEWKSMSSKHAPSPRHFFASCATSSHFYVFGGLWESEPDEVLPLATHQPSYQVVVGESGIGGEEDTNTSAANIIVPLDGLYAFDFVTERWTKIGAASSILDLGRNSNPPAEHQRPAPRYGAHLVPVRGESLMLIGGLDGGFGRSSDEVAVYSIESGNWQRNSMTGSSDYDSASSVSGPVGNGVSEWRGESGHSNAARRSNDGRVREFEQLDARGNPTRIRESVQPGVPARKTNTQDGGFIRASPSPLAGRPRPRIGLCWAVSELDGKLWEFGGQELERTNSGNAVRYGNMVSDVHVYTPNTTPAWQGRPHGSGAYDMTSSRPTDVGGGVWGGDATRGNDRAITEDLQEDQRTLLIYENVFAVSSSRSNGF